MAKLYWKNNGATCCFPLTTTQPSGHYLAVSNNGTTQYVKLSAGVTSALNVNINGTQYGAVSYPETTDLLVTSDFICKRTATTEALCVYANGNLILNTAGTACNNISIPDNATITICGPANAVYLSETMADGYYAANVTRSCACIQVSYRLNCSSTIDAAAYYEYDWEQQIDCCTWYCIGGDTCPHYSYVTVYGHGLTGTHTVSASVVTNLQKGSSSACGYLTCTCNINTTVTPSECSRCFTGKLYQSGSFCSCELAYSDGVPGYATISINGTACASEAIRFMPAGALASTNAINYLSSCFCVGSYVDEYCCFGTYTFTRCTI